MVFATNRKEFLYGIRAQTLLPSKIRPRLRTAKLSEGTSEGRFRGMRQKVVDRAYFIILNKIDELDGTNERLLRYCKEKVENFMKM